MGRVGSAVLLILSLALLFIAGHVSAAGENFTPADLSGILVDREGSPLKNGRVAMFRADRGCRPDTEGIIRVPEGVGYTDPDGRFSISVAPGSYLIGGLADVSGPNNAMLLDNKEFYLAIDNGGAISFYDLASGQNLNLGQVIMKLSARDTGMDTCFMVNGSVTDDNGNPLEGIVVVAKQGFNALRPLYISKPTKSNGRYEIGLAPGRYLFLARPQESSFGRAMPGEILGIYGEDEPVGVGGKFKNAENPQRFIEGVSGELVEVNDIIMFGVPDAEKIKEENQEQ